MKKAAERDRNSQSVVAFGLDKAAPHDPAYIDLCDSDGLVCDEEGAGFGHLEDALNEAKTSARDLVKQCVDNRVSLTETCVEVRNEEGQTVAMLSIAEVLEHPVHPEFKNSCPEDPSSGHH